MLMASEGNLQQAFTGEHPQPWPFSDWYMVVTRPNQEQLVADGFRRRNVRCYWPNEERTSAPAHLSRHRRNTRSRTRFIPIIPGYVFCPKAINRDFEAILESVEGAISIARTFGGDPLFLKEADIEIIRKIEATLNTPQPHKRRHNFKPGDKVRFTDDELHRWPPGKVARCAQEGRISVEVELMGRVATVVVFPHQIERF